MLYEDKNQTSDDFSTLTVEEALSRLESNPATGLTQTEAKQRIERYSPNAVEEKAAYPFRRSWNEVLRNKNGEKRELLISISTKNNSSFH